MPGRGVGVGEARDGHGIVGSAGDKAEGLADIAVKLSALADRLAPATTAGPAAVNGPLPDMVTVIDRSYDARSCIGMRARHRKAGRAAAVGAASGELPSPQSMEMPVMFAESPVNVATTPEKDTASVAVMLVVNEATVAVPLGVAVLPPSPVMVVSTV